MQTVHETVRQSAPDQYRLISKVGSDFSQTGVKE